MDEEEDKFQDAEECWRSGRVGEAVRRHLDLCLNGKNPQVRLGSAMVLVDRLKFPQAPEKLLKVCTVAIESAGRLADAKNLALFVAKKAEYLVTFNGLTLVPARRKLRMPPGWFAFALEREEKEYAELTKQIQANDKDADSLVSDARAMAEKTEDSSTMAQILMCIGTIAFQRYMTQRLDSLPSQILIPSWLLDRLKEYHLDEYVLYKTECRCHMRFLVEQCEARYLEAVKILQDAGDDFLEAYAYYNLANYLRSAYRFGPARKYLAQAQALAAKQGNEPLLKGIQLLEKSIRLKNRDTPNHLAGDRER